VTPVRETVERELKLSAGDSFVLPDLGGEPLEPRVFESTYLDTPDHQLARNGVTLRHRVEDGSLLWQLKLPQGVARLELEHPGPAERVPDELRSLIVAYVRGQELVPLATLQTRREGVRAHGAEVTRDIVTVLRDDGAGRTFEELEVELVGGDEADLQLVTEALRQAGARDAELRPKLFQALGLDLPAAPAEAPEDATSGQALAAAFRVQYAELLLHDPGTRLGTDPEALHQLRVATRRLRAYLRAGRQLLHRGWADDLRGELGWLGGVLGPVRDHDVMLERLRAEIATLDGEDEEAGRALVAELELEREAARNVLLEALLSDRYLALLDRVEAAGDPPLAGVDDVGLVDVWRAERARLNTAVEALGEHPEDDALHAARIKVKRARYAAELAGLDRYVKAAKRLQDVLGEHQDAVVSEARLRAFAVTSPSRAIAAGRLIERERERRARARAGWRDAWTRLEKAGRKAD
jgi:CHAD domain-containing protein